MKEEAEVSLKETALKLADDMEGRARIRRQAKDRLSVQEGKNDRLADQLEASADMIRKLVTESETKCEPVAWMYERPNGSAKLAFIKIPHDPDDMKEIPLYTTLRQL